MKTFLLICILTGFVCQSYAQQIEGNKELYFEKAEKFRKMKTTGQVLTIGGSILAAAGMVTLLSSSTTTTTDSYGQTDTSVDGNIIAGILMYLSGSACAGAGVPLWIVGGINEGRYNRKLETVTLRLKMDPQATGLALRYRF